MSALSSPVVQGAVVTIVVAVAAAFGFDVDPAALAAVVGAIAAVAVGVYRHVSPVPPEEVGFKSILPDDDVGEFQDMS